MRSFKFCLWLMVCLFTLCLSFSAIATSTDTQSFFDDLIRQEQGNTNNTPGSGAPATPACDGGAGCAHLTVNEKGEMVGICALGRWYMSVDNSGMLLSASAPEELTLTNGNHYIFRSTTYNLSGGGDSASISVKDGVSPLFIMGQAKVHTLRLLAGASATLSPGAKINTLDAAGGILNVYGALSFDSITGSLKVAGDGVVQVGNLTAELIAASSGNCRILYTTLGPNAVKNWRQVTLSSGTFPVGLERATYNGYDIPICFEATGNSGVAYVPLSTDTTKNYKVEIINNKAVIQLNPEEKKYEITDADTPLSISGNGVLTGNGNQDVQVNANAVLEVSSASTSGRFTVSSGYTATLTLYGSNRFNTLNVQGTSARISGTGALRVQTIQGSITIDPQTNFSVASNPDKIGGLIANKITILETDSSKPVTNTRIMLKIGKDESFVTTTDDNGCVTLWRASKLDKLSAVALSGGGTYVAMLSDGSGEADALPVITSLTADRKGNVTVGASNAKTYGVQYFVNTTMPATPDGYDADSNSGARWHHSSSSSFTIPGLKHGDVVTLRAFAARDANVTLNAGTNDAFIFSKQLVVTISTKVPFHLAAQEKTYDGASFAFDSSKVNQNWKIEYYDKNNCLINMAPINEGHYTAVITIPADDPTYIAGTHKVEITIKRKRIYVYPYGGMKIKGEHDPRHDFMTDPLVGNDRANGHLSRMAGEGYGNYPYYANTVGAEDEYGNEVSHYSFVIAPDSPYFFIDWNRSHYMYLDPLAIINPVFDELQLGDGRVLKVQTRTADELSMNGVNFGSLVIDTETQAPRPFTPSLRLRQGVDQALIILTAEAELSKDGGYQTDRDGNREWRSRTLTLSPYQINHFKALCIQDMVFSLRDTAVMFSLEDLTNEQIEQRRKDNDMLKLGIRYCFELTPLLSTAGLDADEGAAIPALAERQPLMRVRAYMENGGKQVDISDLLTSAQLLFDASGLMTTGQAEHSAPQDVTETVNGRPVQPKADADSQKDAAISALLGQTEDTQLLDLGSRLLGDEIRRKGYALRRYSDDAANALSSTIIVPYTASERAIPYAAVLRIRPYLITPFNLSSLYGLTPDEAATSKR